MDRLMPHTGSSKRIGITGVPGVGKSTFIEMLGLSFIEEGKNVAVLAIDPSSSISHGSILGDKTRMNQLAIHPKAFIRPTPSGGTLGGVHRKTRETILLCEAFGFDMILVETVGVGQSETAVHQMTDVFLLLLLAGAGDELQGIKRGIMEMADILIIHKADGDNVVSAQRARAEVNAAVRLLPTPPSGWLPQVQLLSSYTQVGLIDLKKNIDSYFNHTINNDYHQLRRKEQAIQWLEDSLGDALHQWLLHQQGWEIAWNTAKSDVQNHLKSPFSAVNELIHKFFPH
jgi:LAO/AO transport system kinase